MFSDNFEKTWLKQVNKSTDNEELVTRESLCFIKVKNKLPNFLYSVI